MPATLDYPTLAIVTAAALAVLWQGLRRARGLGRCRVRRRASLVAPDRRHLYLPLCEAAGEDCVVQVNVPLREVVVPVDPNGVRSGWWRRIEDARLDFVICDAVSLEPQRVILAETADEPARPAHKRQVRRYLAQADIPCITLALDQDYEPSELEDMLDARRAA